MKHHSLVEYPQHVPLHTYFYKGHRIGEIFFHTYKNEYKRLGMDLGDIEMIEYEEWWAMFRDEMREI